MTRSLSRTRLLALLLVLVIVGGTILLAVISTVRFLDEDEGLYHYLAVAVAHGYVPYRDLFYPQMPYLIYVYSWVGSALVDARALSVFFGALILLLCGLLNWQKGLAGVVGVFLLATHSDFLAWTPLFKTYAFAMCASVAAVFLAQRDTRLALITSGGFLGVALCTRLLYVLLIPAFFLYLLKDCPKPRRALVFFGLGFGASVLPCAFLWFFAGENFFLNVVTIQTLRYDANDTGKLLQKFEVALNLVTNPQWTLLLLLSIFGVWAKRSKLTRLENLALYCAVAQTIASFLPSPVYDQYFCCVLPFIALLLPAGIKLVRERYAAWLQVALVAAYLYCGAVAYPISATSYTEPLHSLDEVQKVVTSIRENTRPGDEILAFYPGYAAWSETWNPGELSNNWIYLTKHRFSPRQLELLKIVKRSVIEDWISAHRFHVVVVGDNAQRDEDVKAYLEVLSVSGYKRIYEHYGRMVFRFDDEPKPIKPPA